MSFSAALSPWYLLLCLLAGAAGAFLLYRRHSIPFENHPKLWTRLLTGMRFITITLIALLLFNPLVKTITRRTEKPLIVVAVDNSASMVAGKDSAWVRQQLAKQLGEAMHGLLEKFEVKMLACGEQVTESNVLNFTGRQTNLGQLFTELSERYENQNLGGIVLATDGILNAGSSPLPAAEKMQVPVFAVAAGDTMPRRDLKIKNVRHNEVAYAGNTFPLQVQVDARGFAGASATLTITENGQTLFSQAVQPGIENFSAVYSFNPEAKLPGTRHFVVSITHLPGEITYTNNSRDVFVEVLDSKQKVLLVAAAPHPDVSALRQSIEANKNYELKVVMATEIGKAGELKAYNLAILHQLPSVTNGVAGLFSALRAGSIPILYICGAQTNLQALNNLNTGLNIQSGGASTTDAQALVNTSFGLYSLSETLQQRMKNYPPLQSPFGNYRLTAETDVLAYQQVGYVKTPNPLIVFNKTPAQKCGFVAGEGLWRWRLAEIGQFGNAETFDELVSKTLQYLAAAEDKRPFRLAGGRQFFMVNDAVQFDAELYNESYELVNKPDVQMILTDAAGKNYPYQFSKTGNAYSLNAGQFAPGTYRYVARTSLGGKAYSINGQFVVLPLQAELSETQADHRLLASLAAVSGGKLIYPRQLNQLSSLIAQSETIKPVSYTDRQTQDLIHFRWLFALLLVLLTMEWIARKTNGVV